MRSEVGAIDEQARKALKALKGIVKLQALVRGHLVRRQASVTLKCMQALITAQARARAQRIRMVEDCRPPSRRQSPRRRSTTPDQRLRHGNHVSFDSFQRSTSFPHNILLLL